MIEYRIVTKNKSSEWLDYIELGFDLIILKCLKNMKAVYQDENNVVLDLFQPKMSTTLSFSGMCWKSFIYRRNRTNSQ